jgi:hypothetical protein
MRTEMVAAAIKETVGDAILASTAKTIKGANAKRIFMGFSIPPQCPSDLSSAR